MSDTDPANYFRLGSSRLNIEKLINGQDADAATGPILAAGGTATFTYQVTNTGNIAVGSIVVVDDNGTPGSAADDFNPTFTGGDTNSNGLSTSARRGRIPPPAPSSPASTRTSAR